MTTTAADELRLENRHTGEVLWLRRREENGEPVLDLRGTLPPRSEGPPLHVHFLEDEEGVVISGTISVSVGGRTTEAPAGQSVRLPRGVSHRWWNAGDQPLSFQGVVRPLVDLDRYLHAVFEIMNAGAPNQPSLFYLAHVAQRHRRTQEILIGPRAVRAILFPLIVALGTVLGKYRGSSWPGCPARCTGAPGREAAG